MPVRPSRETMGEGMRSVGLLLAVIALCFTSGCASTLRVGGMASPYYRPAGTGLFYKYGNFCGPGIPVAEGSPTPESIATAGALQPVDYIDFACKVHDMCYLQFGVTRHCDNLFREVLLNNRIASTSNTEIGGHRCVRLIGELANAVLSRTAFHDGFADRVVAPLSATVGVLSSALTATQSFEMQMAGIGWPTEGECRTTDPLPRISFDLTGGQAPQDTPKAFLERGLAN